MSRERRVDPCRMLASVLWLVGSVCVATGDVEASGPEVLTPEALHHAATVVDLHADTLHRLTRPDNPLDLESLQSSPQRLRAGGVDVQFFVLWASPRDPDPSAAVRRQATAFRDVILGDSSRVALARNVADIRRIVDSGRVAALMGLEGGLALGDDPSALRALADQGVAYVSLTWNETNAFGQGTNGGPPAGVTTKGRALIRLANELGVMLDVSHASEATFWDVLTSSRRPVIASHSNAASVHPHPRNLDDAQLWAIAESGGVVGLNLFSAFVSARKPRASLQDLMAHVRHLRAVVGDAHIAIGTDFDGSPDPVQGLEDASRMALLTRTLVAEGLDPDAIRGILGDNVLRVLDRTQRQDPVRIVTHRPAKVLRVDATTGRATADRVADRNARTSWAPGPSSRGVDPAVRLTVAGPGVDRVGVCANGPGEAMHAFQVVIQAWCGGRRVGPPVPLEVGGEVRPYRVGLPGLASCRRPTIEVVLPGRKASDRPFQLAEILCEVAVQEDAITAREARPGSR